MSNGKFDKKEIGSLWTRTSKAGNEFLSGHVEINGKKVGVMVFTNRSDNPKAPAYRIFEDDFVPGQKTASSGPAKKTNPVPAKKKAPVVQNDDFVDEGADADDGVL